MDIPAERYDHAGRLATAAPIDRESDLIPINLWFQQQAALRKLNEEIDSLRMILHEIRVMAANGVVECEEEGGTFYHGTDEPTRWHERLRKIGVKATVALGIKA